MSSLLVKPSTPDENGCVTRITPESAGWSHVGYEVYRLKPGQKLARNTGDKEHCLVVLTGKCTASAGGDDYGEIGERMNVFEGKHPWAVYATQNTDWAVEATTDLELAVCSAPGGEGHVTRLITPEMVRHAKRGTGTNQRLIYDILMEAEDAESLLVVEVITPQGNWSSYPPHRHDTDDFPNQTFLEETYYHRLNPPQGFGFQRVYTDDRELDESMAIETGDTVMVPKGYHPCGAPYGYDLYYLNVMAGPLRKWRIHNDPDHEWIFNRDRAALEQPTE